MVAAGGDAVGVEHDPSLTVRVLLRMLRRAR
jgi:hypothetical protein